MTDIPILRDLGMILVAATFLVLSGRRFGVPTIAAYLLAGLFLGPISGLLTATESVELLAEVGIILLLFLVGLELSVAAAREAGRVVLIVATAQIILTAVGGYGVSLLQGFSATEALVLGVALTFSSTVVTVKLLDQKGAAGSRYGRIAIGVLLVQDVAVIVALTALSGLDPEAGAEPAAMAIELGISLLAMAALVSVAILSARTFLERVMGWAAKSLEVLFIWSLAWCFLFVEAAAFLELSVEIGAFLAGISLAQLPHSDELRRRVHPLMNFFVAIFFVSLGLHMDLGMAIERWEAVLALTAFVMVGKFLVVMVSTALVGESRQTAFRAGVALSQVSEFSFIFATLAIAKGYIGADALSILGGVGLLTIGGSSALILADEKLFLLARRSGVLGLLPGSTESEDEPAPDLPLYGHVIVVGMNALGRRIVEGLILLGETVVAIDTDSHKLADIPCQTVLGSVDHPSVLDAAGLDHAKMVVSALQIEEANNLLAFRARSAGVPVSIHAFDRAVVPELREIGVDHLIDSKSAGLRTLAQTLRRLEEAAT
jgi:Kef-type K+ transport system membrane component KefB